MLPAVSSTDVRALAAAKRWGELEHVIPREVLAYIREKGLYA
jgi:hypothetical protein